MDYQDHPLKSKLIKKIRSRFDRIFVICNLKPRSSLFRFFYIMSSVCSTVLKFEIRGSGERLMTLMRDIEAKVIERV